MKCVNCGHDNLEGTKFCVNCGSALTLENSNFEEQVVTPVTSEESDAQVDNLFEETEINTVSENQKTTGAEAEVLEANSAEVDSLNGGAASQAAMPSAVSTGALNYITYFVNSVIKPADSFKKEADKLKDFKNSGIITLIVAVIMTLCYLVRTIINTIHVYEFNWFGKSGYTWKLDKLGDINYISVIGKGFLISAGLIVVIAFVFYVVSLIMKKEFDFSKSLAISSTSLVPGIVTSLIVSPILGMIWPPLGVVILILGVVYSFVMLYELMNSEVKLEGNVRVYYNAICFGILFIIAYYVIMNVLTSSLGEVGELTKYLG